ncbi:MAG TPA: YceI family protein [Ktedonobacterales bacterium]|nr:YceI family protein [Ktedonobacterales bacterium]
MAYTIDSNHTLIEFSVKHMMVTTVKGRFKRFGGEVHIDEAQPDASKVDVTIETASIDTGAEPRDNHLRGADFFDAEKYPTITFTSKRVEPLGDERYRVLGDLTIHGVTREIPLEITREGVTKTMQGKQLQAFSAAFTINRKDFGLEWNVALENGGWLVSDQIKISLEVEVVEAAAVAA